MPANHALPGTADRSVLLLLSSLVVGGSERKAVALANGLRARGWNVHVLYIDHPARSPSPLLGELDPAIPRDCLGRRGRYSPAAVLRLYRYLRRQRITRIVCVNLYPLAYVAPLAPVLRRGVFYWLGLVNSSHFTRPRDRLFMALYRRILRSADRLVFGCRYQLEHWIQGYGLDPRKAGIIYNGIDLTRFEPRAQAAAVDRELVIGTVGQLRPEKNQAELLRAAAPLLQAGHRVRIVLVGDGPEAGALRKLAGALGIADSVTFVGQVADVRDALAGIDVFVLSSRTETFSNAALEAMAMGRPVVLSRVGGAAEMVREGCNGFLYRSGAPEELTQILQRLVDSSAQRARLGRQARAVVEERFDFVRMLDEYENALLDDPAPPRRDAPSARRHDEGSALPCAVGSQGGKSKCEG